MGEGILKGVEAGAVFIIKEGNITYKQLVPEIKQEPDFNAVLKAISGIFLTPFGVGPSYLLFLIYSSSNSFDNTSSKSWQKGS
ncbi:MAG TPA: hypothetical protein EYO73_08375 [Sulfurimonas sp.]|nr:hypothetical protein [Sulfurimonas sp.]